MRFAAFYFDFEKMTFTSLNSQKQKPEKVKDQKRHTKTKRQRDKYKKTPQVVIKAFIK